MTPNPRRKRVLHTIAREQKKSTPQGDGEGCPRGELSWRRQMGTGSTVEIPPPAIFGAWLIGNESKRTFVLANFRRIEHKGKVNPKPNHRPCRNDPQLFMAFCRMTARSPVWLMRHALSERATSGDRYVGR